MTLINIDYGSLANSETMNKNFSYLDNKISETADSINTTIASILSNIATINSRMSDLSENISNVDGNLDKFKTKIVNMVETTTMLPDWTQLKGIDFPFIVPANGYLLFLPGGAYSGTLTVNGVTVQFKRVDEKADYSVQMVAMPVKAGDFVQCTVPLLGRYFLPAMDVDYSEETEEIE